jgi:hypothetical protein
VIINQFIKIEIIETIENIKSTTRTLKNVIIALAVAAITVLGHVTYEQNNKNVELGKGVIVENIKKIDREKFWENTRYPIVVTKGLVKNSDMPETRTI